MSSASTWFRNLKLSIKVLIAVLLAVAGMVILGVNDIAKMSALDTAASNIYENNAKPMDLAARLRAATNLARIATLNHLLATKPAERQTLEQELASQQTGVEQALAELNKFSVQVLTPEGKDALETFSNEWAEFHRLRDAKILPLSRQGKVAQAFALYKEQVRPHALAAAAAPARWPSRYC